MSTPLRLAFLGIDNPHGAAWRELLFENFAHEIEITALVPGFEGATTSLEEKLSAVPRFDDAGDLISRGADLFDAAFIALPNCDGPAAATALANAGKHLFIEKPCAASANDFVPVADAVAASNVAFQNGFMWRYDEGAGRLRDMLSDGRFGKLISIEMTFVTSDVKKRGPEHYLFDREQSGGGFLSWLGCHYLDLLLWITGRQPAAVTSRTGVFGATKTDVEDGGIAIIDLEGGAISTFLGGYWLPRWAGESRWALRGSERWVHWIPGQSLDIHGPQPQWNAMEEHFSLAAADEESAIKGYGGQLGVSVVRDWLDGIADESGRACRNTPQSTLDTLRLLDNIYRASAEAKTLTCSPIS